MPVSRVSWESVPPPLTTSNRTGTPSTFLPRSLRTCTARLSARSFPATPVATDEPTRISSAGTAETEPAAVAVEPPTWAVTVTLLFWFSAARVSPSSTWAAEAGSTIQRICEAGILSSPDFTWRERDSPSRRSKWAGVNSIGDEPCRLSGS